MYWLRLSSLAAAQSCEAISSRRAIASGDTSVPMPLLRALWLGCCMAANLSFATKPLFEFANKAFESAE
jgi:hypothetical protein